MTTTSLIQQVKNILAYDLEVPVSDPDVMLTDAQILDYLNIAQDELARILRLYSPAIPFSIGACSSIPMTDSSFAKRIDELAKFLLSTGEELVIGDISEYNPALIVNATQSKIYIDSGTIYFEPPITATTTGFVQGWYLPDTLTLINSTGLPSELADRHLARFCIATNAQVFAIEAQQQSRLTGMYGEAMDACAKYNAKNRMNRKTFVKPQPAYRV